MGSCESCGMPMDGKTTCGYDNRYCVYCMDEKTGFLRSKNEVREGSINSTMKVMGKNREDAEKIVDEVMPKLPRWRKK